MELLLIALFELVAESVFDVLADPFVIDGDIVSMSHDSARIPH
jgi:hypothetical protein